MSKKGLYKICLKHGEEIRYMAATGEHEYVLHNCPACVQVANIKKVIDKYKHTHFISNDIVDEIEGVFQGYIDQYLKTQICWGCENLPGAMLCTEHR